MDNQARKKVAVFWDFENSWKTIKNLATNILRQKSTDIKLPYITIDYYQLMETLRQDDLIFMFAAFPAYLYQDEQAKKIIRLMQQDGFCCLTADVDNSMCKKIDGIDEMLSKFGIHLIASLDRDIINKIIIISDDVDFLSLGTNALNKGMDVLCLETYLMSRRITKHPGIKCRKIPILGYDKIINAGIAIPTNIY